MILFGQNKKHSSKVLCVCVCVYVCMYKMVLKVTKETWGKCGIKTVEHHNEEKNMIKLWQKMSNIEIQLGYSHIRDITLKRIKKYYVKKAKDITEEEKEKYKAFFEGETVIFIIEKRTRDIIESYKLSKAIELRKKLGYNHNDIMVPEETSIAEKIIKLFPNENVVLKKSLTTENQIFGLKIIILLLKLMKEIMKIMIQMMKKKEKTCLKIIILKFFDVIPIILSLIFLNF